MAPNKRAEKCRPAIVAVVIACIAAGVFPQKIFANIEMGLDLKKKTFTTSDGQTFGVEYHGNLRDGSARAVIVAVHGLSGAATDFDPLGEELARDGFPLISYNLRGQGLDPLEKRRGDISDFNLYLDDLSEFMEHVHTESGGKPLFLLGESMGALIVACTASNGLPEYVGGIVLSSPVVRLKNAEPPAWQKALIRTLFFVAPLYRLDPTSLADEDAPPPEVTRDEAYAEKLENSEQKIEKFTLRFFRNLIEMTRAANASATSIKVPVCILYAGKDVFVDAEDIEEFFDRIASDDKVAYFFPDHYHLLFRDRDSDMVIEKLSGWLSSRSSRR